MTEPELVAIDLDEDERQLMVQGLLFRMSGAEEFQALVWRLLEAVDNKEPLSPFDWSRAVLVTEIAWASDLVGSGIEFARGGILEAYSMVAGHHRRQGSIV
jgi:hypothetical protein